MDVETESVVNHCIWPKKHNPRVWGFFDIDYFLAICSDFPHFPFQRPKISYVPTTGIFFSRHNAVISHTFNLLSYPDRGSNKAATSKRSSWEIFFVFFQTLFPVLVTTILDIFAITSLSKKTLGFSIQLSYPNQIP